jgi:hypothetical protein
MNIYIHLNHKHLFIFLSLYIEYPVSLKNAFMWNTKVLNLTSHALKTEELVYCWYLKIARVVQ